MQLAICSSLHQLERRGDPEIDADVPIRWTLIASFLTATVLRTPWQYHGNTMRLRHESLPSDQCREAAIHCFIVARDSFNGTY